METVALDLIALCGFIAGATAKINAHAVPQRGPNLFWLGPVLLIDILALWGGIESAKMWFFTKSLFWFFVAVVPGAALAFLFREETPHISD